MSDSGEIKGIDVSRKQADILDLLRSYPFAGGNITLIQIETIEMEGKSLDVLLILNSEKVPYYLEPRGKKYKVIKEGLIYSRRGDSNTPLDKNSEPSVIEYLWKKRFGIDITPKERVVKLLSRKNEWEHNGQEYFHSVYPEFTISITLDNDCNHPQFYSYVMMNSSTKYRDIEVKYRGVTLYTDQEVVLDSGRYVTSVPEWESLCFDDFHHENYPYKYYIKGDIKYKLHEFLLKKTSEEALLAHKRFLSVVLLFDSEVEKEQFNNYLLLNEEFFLRKLNEKQDNNYIEYGNIKERKEAQKRIATGKILKEMLEEFRINKKMRV
ncbi:helix-turn-helix domain-containing protein [Cytobacillus sp. Hm23]